MTWDRGWVTGSWPPCTHPLWPTPGHRAQHSSSELDISTLHTQRSAAPGWSAAASQPVVSRRLLADLWLGQVGKVLAEGSGERAGGGRGQRARAEQKVRRQAAWTKQPGVVSGFSLGPRAGPSRCAVQDSVLAPHPFSAGTLWGPQSNLTGRVTRVPGPQLCLLS